MGSMAQTGGTVDGFPEDDGAPRHGRPGAGWSGAGQAAAGDPVAAGARDPQALLDAALPDLDWSQLPEGFIRSNFAAPSGRLAMITLGPAEGTPVVLVPGATGSKEDFVLMMPILAAAGCRTVSFDMAGQYESAAAGPENLEPPQPHYTHELFTNDLLAVLADVTETARRPAHVVGYSFAGTVAGLAHERAPEMFASLTLLSCPPLAGQSFRGISRIGPITFLATGRIGAAVMIWGIKQNLVPVAPGRLRFVRDRLTVTRRQSVRDIMALMKQAPDLVPSLSAAALPKLVAVGEHDLWPSWQHARFAELLGARLAVYPAGHSPCETSPHQLCLDLLELFDSAH